MRHIFTLDKPPERCPTNTTTDAAFTGNGDLGIVWGGKPDKLCFYITKSDFWKSTEGNCSDGGIGPVAELHFKMPSLFASTYHVEEDIDKAEVRGEFSDATSKLEMRTVVLAEKNVILLEMKITGARLSHSVELTASEANKATVEKKNFGGISVVKRGFSGEDCLFDTYAVTSLRLLEAKNDGNTRKYSYIICVATNHDTQAYEKACIRTASEFTTEDLENELGMHERHWKSFWAKSSVTVPYEDIEMMWYMGQYAMACCTGNNTFPPGLYGNIVTQDNMAWHSDYHLNYNYQAPFYAATTSNHTEFLDCYHKPLEDFIPEGERLARELLGCKGIYFPVGIGPLGMNTSSMSGSNEHGELFNGQKINASYAAVLLTMRWYGTYDIDYAEKHAYPFMKKLAEFWEDYLVYENGRYVNYNDAAHEVHYYTGANYIPERHDDMNSAISLGLIRMIMRCLIDISEELGTDSDKRKKWKHILDNISEYPILIKDGKPMFRLTEKGHEWTGGNGLDTQHVYPCSEVFFHKDKELAQAAQNSLFMPERWEDSNACSSIYPTAARMGIAPDYIIEKLRGNIEHHVMPNGLFNFYGGGIENTSVVPSTINEMLLQSYEGTVRLFANWNRKTDASFEKLRANGAFTVSASLKNGSITAEILSEKGRILKIENPYSDREITVSYNGKKHRVAPSEAVIIRTSIGMTVKVS